MLRRKMAVRALSALAGVGLTCGGLVAAADRGAIAAAQATVSCPAVAADGTVSPALAPGADWQGCSLAGANLAGADLSGANLRLADLAGSDLSGAILANAEPGGVRLDGANISGTICRLAAGWLEVACWITWPP